MVVLRADIYSHIYVSYGILKREPGRQRKEVSQETSFLYVDNIKSIGILKILICITY